tara:strand:- start:176 stop:2659 length:2484 start_codon:yes stop_codon:yes gene_type:complete
MTAYRSLTGRFFVAVLITFSTALGIASSALSAVPIVQPGAPGEPTRALDAQAAVAIAASSYTAADIEFMQGMIGHHHQALLMSQLATDRTNNQAILDVARRIEVSQKDEMRFMQDWLHERDEPAPDPTQPENHHAHHTMAGMATKKQMAELSAAQSTDFDRLFLRLMITHHDGAIEMVDDLRDQSGSTYDPQLNEFVSDVSNDQAVEIERMNTLLVGLSSDPRAGLSAGLYDAGEAILNMQLVMTQPRPLGFFDPANPEGRGVEDPEESADDSAEADIDAKPAEPDSPRTMQAASEARRYPMLSFDNTDMAFSENLLVTGSYHGFNMYQIDDAGLPNLITSVVCPGGQGDISIIGDLLIMSVEQTRGRLDCGRQGVTTDASAERFQGIRIFDISDLSQPLQVGAVQTCRGSHTHSVIAGPTPDGKILIYNSGTQDVRDEEELANCIDEIPGDDRTALFRIDVIEIPIDDPAKSRIIDSPAVFADPDTGTLAGLWRGGDHGDNTQDTERTEHCHDITVFPSANLAAGACSGNGILFDISDPRKPERIDAVTDDGFAYWHSATFNNAGTKVLFTDEWGGGGRARCRAWDPMTWGADAIYDIVDQQLKFKSHYKIPAPQLETENCVAHNGSIIPVPGRDIFIQAWYQGGITVIDFTDSSNPTEIGYFDRGPILADELIAGGYWSVYYYRGMIYGTEIIRGLDTLKLLPSEYLSANEIAAAAMAYPSSGPRGLFNPQRQVPMTWPANPVVARAYIDQLRRTNTLSSATAKKIVDVLDQVTAAMDSGGSKKLARQLDKIRLPKRKSSLDATSRSRLSALADTLKGISQRLRG